MIQPSVYSRESIVDAAFELIRESGWAAVSTRAIAKKLGSSTMPIYSHVKSIDELEKDLRLKARVHLREFQHRTYTEFPLLNLAFGYIAFARDERNVFRFLFLDRPDPIASGDLNGMKEMFYSEFGEDSDESQALSGMSPERQEALIRYTWIFTHGLAMLVNSGALGVVSDDTILTFLRNAGEAFYIWAANSDSGKKPATGDGSGKTKKRGKK
ncbi:MAG: TetR/AcrR family transcriptional regulator [Spirochaetaceae bacterium]|nr:MAG: TetR/AcrR family transcriptional regulator [Spirochaetaceae bacterium]